MDEDNTAQGGSATLDEDGLLSAFWDAGYQRSGDRKRVFESGGSKLEAAAKGLSLARGNRNIVWERAHVAVGLNDAITNPETHHLLAMGGVAQEIQELQKHGRTAAQIAEVLSAEREAAERAAAEYVNLGREAKALSAMLPQWKGRLPTEPTVIAAFNTEYEKRAKANHQALAQKLEKAKDAEAAEKQTLAGGRKVVDGDGPEDNDLSAMENALRKYHDKSYAPANESTHAVIAGTVAAGRERPRSPGRK